MPEFFAPMSQFSMNENNPNAENFPARQLLCQRE
jgi:hypothetical protein